MLWQWISNWKKKKQLDHYVLANVTLDVLKPNVENKTWNLLSEL